MAAREITRVAMSNAFSLLRRPLPFIYKERGTEVWLLQEGSCVGKLQLDFPIYRVCPS